MWVEVLCGVELVPKVAGTHECLLLPSTPKTRMVICARVIMYIRVTL